MQNLFAKKKLSPFKWFYATLYFLPKTINENNRCSDKVLVFYIFVTENDKKIKIKYNSTFSKEKFLQVLQ